MNPHAPHPISLSSLVLNLWRQRSLVLQMTKRDVIGRYKGSVMGVMWSLLNPLFLLLIYTLVFSIVFKARWGDSPVESKSEFAILLFVGMIVHSLFSETLSRAPGLILNNVSYVKKIVFPLEILPVVAICAALFHALVSLFVLAFFFVIQNGYLQWTIVFLPLIVLPFLALTLGIAWILTSLGVFIRDIAQPIGLILTILLFASPVFYPLDALPGEVRPWLMINPLTFIIDQVRLVILFGKFPDWTGLAAYSVFSVFILWTGYIWFQKSRKGFANVV